MTWSFKLTDTNNLLVTATSRTNTNLVVNTNVSVSGAPNAIEFYATNMAAGDNRQPYFNNLQISQGDATPPVVTLSADQRLIAIPVGGTYTADAGATATDEVSGDVTSSITNNASTAVNLAQPGTYTVTYTARDAANNAGTATQTVVVHPVGTFASLYSSMAAPGTYAFSGTWSPDGTNNTAMIKVANFQWALARHMTTPGNFSLKFAANGGWAIQWGISSTPGIAQVGGEVIPFSVPTTGVYTLSFNENTRAYAIARATTNGLTYTQWAAQYGLAAGSGSADADSDALSNEGEYGANTDPLNPDTDGDGYTDGGEVNGTGPGSLGRVTDPLRKNYGSMVVARDFSVPPWNEAPTAPYQMVQESGDDFSWRLSKRFTNPVTLWYQFLGGSWTNRWGTGGSAGKAAAGGGNLRGDVTVSGLYTITFNTETLDTTFGRAAFADYAGYAVGYGLGAGTEDADADGRTNQEEFEENTDPLNSDTDGDGRSDGAEHVDGTDRFQKNYTITVAGEFQSPMWRAQPWPTNAPVNLMSRGAGTNQFLHTAKVYFPSGSRTFKSKFANGEPFGSCEHISWGSSSSPNVAQTGGGEMEWYVAASGIHTITFHAETLAYTFGRAPTNGLTFAQWAVQYGRATNSQAADPDFDGLTNLQEFGRNTDPVNVDTDGDGLNDGDEVGGTYASLFLYDSEGIEVFLLTNPLLGDSDGDGLGDRWEIENTLDPTDDGTKLAYANYTVLPIATTGANPNGRNADPDADGFTNLEEALDGTNPVDPNSKPAIRLITFQVDMRQEMARTNNPFNPTNHGVEVRGDFNQWQAGLTLTNSSQTNGIYSGQFPVRGNLAYPKTFYEKRILYKFYGTRTNGGAPALEWEPYEERVYGYESGVTNKVLPLVVFGDNISRRNVTFSVDMSQQIFLGRFDPATDKVFLVGDAADWRNQADWAAGLEMAAGAAPNTSVYSVTLEFLGPKDLARGYRYRIQKALGQVSEINDLDPASCGYQGRGFQLGSGGQAQTIGPAFFNNWASAPTTRTVTFAVDMAVQAALGRFVPGTDQVYVTGDVTAGLPPLEMIRAGGTSIYTLDVAVPGEAGAELRYRFLSGNLAVGNNGYEGDLDPDDGIETQRVLELADVTPVVLATVPFNGVATAPAYRDVIFAVDMSVQESLGKFTPGTDKVYLMGEATDWTTGREMQRQGTSGTYELRLTLAGDAGITKKNYKFRSGRAGAASGGFEGDVNPAPDLDTRVVTLGPAGTDQELALAMFDNDNSVVRNVTLAVDMSVQQQLGRFNPETDKVFLVGELTDWGTGVEMPRVGTTGAVFQLTLPAGGAPDAVRYYKFKSGNAAVGNSGYEGDVNPSPTEDRRVLTMGPAGQAQDVPKVFFNNKEVALLRDVTFALDMRVQQFKNAFASGEKVVVSGDFNGWGTNNELTLDTGSGLHRATLSIEGAQGATNNYKFRILGPTRTNDGLQYEATADRPLVLGATNAATNLATAFFNNLEESRKITFRVNMSVQAAKGNFNTNTGVVQLAGSFNGWSTTATPLVAQGHGIYAVEVTVDGPLSGVGYKFLKGTTEADYEPGSDRTIPALLPNLQASSLDPVFFGNDDGVAPTDIALSASSIAENNAANATVGTLSSTDDTVGDTHTYSLVAGTGDTDNGSFNISGNSLRAGVAFDFETKRSYSVRVRSTDAKGNFFEEAFTITVTDVNEGTTFTGWSGGAELTAANVGKYAIGGASSLAATDGVAPASTVSGGNLVLTAIVRVDDPKLTVVGEAVGSLTDYGTPASITSVTGSATGIDQTGVPAGCEKQAFTVAQDGGRKFLRLKAVLAP